MDGELNAVCERTPTGGAVYGQNWRTVRAYDLPIPYLFLSLTCVQLSLVMSFNCHLLIRCGLLGVYIPCTGRSCTGGCDFSIPNNYHYPNGGVDRLSNRVTNAAGETNVEKNPTIRGRPSTGSFRRNGK